MDRDNQHYFCHSGRGRAEHSRAEHSRAERSCGMIGQNRRPADLLTPLGMTGFMIFYGGAHFCCRMYGLNIAFFASELKELDKHLFLKTNTVLGSFHSLTKSLANDRFLANKMNKSRCCRPTGLFIHPFPLSPNPLILRQLDRSSKRKIPCASP